MKNQIVAEVKSYPRDLVFAAACAAQRINGEYVKRTSQQYRNPHEKKPDANGTKLPNGSIMKAILASDRSDILPQDYEKAELVRSFFCAMITLVFSGDAREFMKSAVDAATCEEIGDSSQMLMLVASLPSVYETNTKRQRERDSLREISENSIPLKNHEGESVKLTVRVIDSIFKQRWGSYAVNALVEGTEDTHVIFFFDRKPYEKDKTYHLSGRIKSKNGQTTQLHYVRQAEDKK